jgi:prepilin-type processing-associated H-X9-DG protein
VELLVVIGIIGILVSILLPVLAGARKKAQTIQCAANLRTLGQAWILYSNTNRRVSAPARMPTSGAAGGVYYTESGAQYRPRWYELLGDAIGRPATRRPRTNEDDSWLVEDPVFLCPAVPDWNNSRNFPYGYNFQFLGNARPKQSGSGWINWPVIASRLKGSQTVMALDTMGTAATVPKSQRTGYYAEGSHDPNGLCNKGWALDPPLVTAASDHADPQRPSFRSGPDPRHGNKVNAVFCDGHVDLMTPQDLGYVVLPDGSMPAVAPAHNKYFSGTGENDLPPPR